MDNSNWGNSGSGFNEHGSFMSLLESGIYPENYPNYFCSTQTSELGDEGPSYDQHGQPWCRETTGAEQSRATETCAEPVTDPHSRASTFVRPVDDSSSSDNDETLLQLGTVGWMEGIKIQHSRQKPQPYHTSILRGSMRVTELFNGCDDRFQREMGMHKDTFRKIVVELEEIYGWSRKRLVKDGVSCNERLAIFMHVMRGNTNAKTQETFQHSGDTVSRHVHKILACMNRGFIVDKIKPTRRQVSPHPYLDRRDFYRPFKGQCIGALDGTHVMIRCRKKEEERKFFGRKGYATQNILAVCDFDLTFTFVSVGWEGTHHDYSIFKRCVLNPDYNFPQPEAGKYYLVDAGYPNRPGYLAPYKGLRYHQADFRRGRRRPTNGREYFNRAHSSLRSCVERTFGVWKARFKFLENMPWYSIKTQVGLVLASMAIHNFIRRDRVPDEYFLAETSPIEYAFEDLPDADPEQEDREDIRDDHVDYDHDPSMDDIRNDITRALCRQRSRRC